MININFFMALVADIVDKIVAHFANLTLNWSYAVLPIAPTPSINFASYFYYITACKEHLDKLSGIGVFT